jgi:hypothetical protein
MWMVSSRSHAQQTGFAPQVVAIKFDLPIPEGQFALTIDADAGWLSLAWPRCASSRGHACAVERAANADLWTVEGSAPNRAAMR